MTHRASASLQILGRTLAQWRAMSRNVGHRSFVTAHHHWSLVTLAHRVLAEDSHFTVTYCTYCTYCSAPDTCHLSRKSGSNLYFIPVTSGASKFRNNPFIWFDKNNSVIEMICWRPGIPRIRGLSWLIHLIAAEEDGHLVSRQQLQRYMNARMSVSRPCKYARRNLTLDAEKGGERRLEGVVETWA